MFFFIFWVDLKIFINQFNIAVFAVVKNMNSKSRKIPNPKKTRNVINTKNRSVSSYTRSSVKKVVDIKKNSDAQFGFYECTVKENISLKKEVKLKSIMVNSLLTDLNAMRSYLEVVDQRRVQDVALIKGLHDTILKMSTNNEHMSVLYQQFFPDGLDPQITEILKPPETRKYNYQKNDNLCSCDDCVMSATHAKHSQELLKQKQEKEQEEQNRCEEIKKLNEDILCWKDKYFKFKQLFQKNHSLTGITYKDYGIINMIVNKNKYKSYYDKSLNLLSEESKNMNLKYLANDVDSLYYDEEDDEDDDDNISNERNSNNKKNKKNKNSNSEAKIEKPINININYDNSLLQIEDRLRQKQELDETIKLLTTSREIIQNNINELIKEENQLKENINNLSITYKSKMEVSDINENVMSLDHSIKLAEKDTLDVQYNMLKDEITKLELYKSDLIERENDNSFTTLTEDNSNIVKRINYVEENEKDKQIMILQERVKLLTDAYNQLKEDYNSFTLNSSDCYISDSILSSVDEIVSKYDL